MPGILPMKVIKVGGSAQPRIAQACDRCRSKKIRCDGIRPSCTQCFNVGFECKTSDKLSRRAFPRGYTESLEERVRGLEAEVRELRGLLDEKEEKLEMLSRVRTRASPNSRSSKTSSKNPTVKENETQESEDDEAFTVVQSTLSIDKAGDNVDGVFMGTSSTRSLMMAFKRRAQESPKGLCINVDAMISSSREAHSCSTMCSTTPALMLSDRLVNTFFQEIAPLFPILHRPSFLEIYNEYIVSPSSITDKKSLAQLYFAFAIASLSKHSGATAQDVAVLECQGLAALDSFISDNSLVTVQCLTLAALYFMMKSEWTTMLRYKGQAVVYAQRLGLDQSQKRFVLDSLTVEVRRRVFWTIYSLDCFSAAHLGLPTLFSDVDVQCELPFDADDEYITTKGFLPSLPGESTRLSSALALFRLSKVLSRILSELYPAKAQHELSFKKIAALQDELDTWSLELAPHLKLQFEKDKPFTGVVSHRSPVLSLAYYYTHTFISRPTVLATPSLYSRCSPSIVSLAASSKRIFQVMELLDERNLALAFCFSEKELLKQSAVGLLLQYLEMGSDAKLINSVFEKLDKLPDEPADQEFKKLAEICRKDKTRSSHRHSSSESKIRHSKKEDKRAAKSGKSKEKNAKPESKSSRKSLPYITPVNRASSSESMSSVYNSNSLFARSEPPFSPQQPAKYPVSSLDYMPFTPSDPTTLPFSGMGIKDEGADWVQMLSNLDNGQSNIYDEIYGGPTNNRSNGTRNPPPSLGDYSSLASNSPTLQSVPRSSQMSLGQNGLAQGCETDLWTVVPEFGSPIEGVEMSEESPLSSVEDINGVQVGVSGMMTPEHDFSLFEAFV